MPALIGRNSHGEKRRRSVRRRAPSVLSEVDARDSGGSGAELQHTRYRRHGEPRAFDSLRHRPSVVKYYPLITSDLQNDRPLGYLVRLMSEFGPIFFKLLNPPARELTL